LETNFVAAAAAAAAATGRRPEISVMNEVSPTNSCKHTQVCSFMFFLLSVLLYVLPQPKPQEREKKGENRQHAAGVVTKSAVLTGSGRLHLSMNNGATLHGEYLTLNESVRASADMMDRSLAAVYGEVSRGKRGRLEVALDANTPLEHDTAVLLNNNVVAGGQPFALHILDVNDDQNLCDICGKLHGKAKYILFLDSCVDIIKDHMGPDVVYPPDTKSSEELCTGPSRTFIRSIRDKTCCTSIAALPVLHIVSGLRQVTLLCGGYDFSLL
jgi:hypothetical protein